MILAIVVLAMGCKTGEKAVLTGHEWQLSRISMGQDSLAVPTEAPTILFTDSAAVYGFAGCNRFFGSYTVAEKDQMTVQPGGMTMMMCPEGQFENEFMKALAGVTTYMLSADELKLTDAVGNVTMVFVPKDTTQLIGGEKDAHGCNAAAGFTWSEVRQDCIRLFEAGVRLNSATDSTATTSAFIVFSADSAKVEVFLPNEDIHPVLYRRVLPAGGYAWNIEDDDTKNVRMVDGKWVIEQRMQTLYVQE